MIGMDHVEQLGPSIENIAWHKSGIFKPHTPAFTVPQEPSVMQMMEQRAIEKNANLTIVDTDNLLLNDALVLRQSVQRTNASLAAALSRSLLRRRATGGSHNLTQQDIQSGLDNFFWLGRFQQINEGPHQWFLDGAHNESSIPHAAHWFADMTSPAQE